MRQETIEKHIEDLCTLKEALGQRVHKLDNLRDKLHVNLKGDVLGGQYEMTFSHIPRQTTQIEKSIIDEFCQEYGLRLIEDVCKVDSMINFFETINRKTAYCEVDLFNPEKPPVEC